MKKKFCFKTLFLVIASSGLVACDSKIENCNSAGGGFDYELKECRCYQDNQSDQCDVLIERPANSLTQNPLETGTNP